MITNRVVRHDRRQTGPKIPARRIKTLRSASGVYLIYISGCDLVERRVSDALLYGVLRRHRDARITARAFQKAGRRGAGYAGVDCAPTGIWAAPVSGDSETPR